MLQQIVKVVCVCCKINGEMHTANRCSELHRDASCYRSHDNQLTQYLVLLHHSIRQVGSKTCRQLEKRGYLSQRKTIPQNASKPEKFGEVSPPREHILQVNARHDGPYLRISQPISLFRDELDCCDGNRDQN